MRNLVIVGAALLLGVVGCGGGAGGGDAKSAEAAKGELTVEMAGKNPVFRWKLPEGQAPTLFMVRSPNCEHVDREHPDAVKTPEGVTFWGIQIDPAKGFSQLESPIVYGITPPEAQSPNKPLVLDPRCKYIATLAVGTTYTQQGFNISESSDIEAAKVTAAELKIFARTKEGVAAAKAASKPAGALPAVPTTSPEAYKAIAGTYELVQVNGKPLPFDYGGGTTLAAAKVVLQDSGAYSTDSTLDIKGKKTPYPTSGKFGVDGKTAKFAATSGKSMDDAQFDEAAGTLTATSNGATYLYKRAQ